MYKAIVEARPLGLDFIHAATQVSPSAVEISVDSIYCNIVHSSCFYAKNGMFSSHLCASQFVYWV